MKHTLTRLAIRTEVREMLGEPDAEKTWSDAHLNRLINAALRDISAYGVIRGYEEDSGDGGDTYPVPESILCLVKATIGTAEYRPTKMVDMAFTQYDADRVYLDETPTTGVDDSVSSLTATFPSAITTGTEILFHGWLYHPEYDPEDTDDDAVVFLLDNRFANVIVSYVMSRALRGTEDDYRRFQEEYVQEIGTFGLKRKIMEKAIYSSVERRYADRCRW